MSILVASHLAGRERSFARHRPFGCDDARGVSQWRMAAGIGLLVLLLGIVLLESVRTGPSHRGAQQVSTPQASAGASPAVASCARWHSAAVAAVTHLLHSGAPAEQVQQAALWLRHARVTCNMGWIALACADYKILLNGPPFPELRRARADRHAPCRLKL